MSPSEVHNDAIALIVIGCLILVVGGVIDVLVYKGIISRKKVDRIIAICLILLFVIELIGTIWSYYS